MVSQISKHNENINSGDISPTVQPHLSLEDTSLGPGGGPPHENERMSPKRNHFQKEKIFHSLIFIGDDDVYMLVFNWSYSKATTFGTPPRSPNWRKKTGEKKCKKIWVPLFKKIAILRFLSSSPPTKELCPNRRSKSPSPTCKTRHRPTVLRKETRHR